MVVSYSIHLFMMCRSTHLPFTCILCPYNHSDLRSHYKRILIIHLCSSLLSTSIYMINRDDLFIIMLLLLLLGVCLLSILSPSLFPLLIVWCGSRLCWHGYFYLCSCFFVCYIFLLQTSYIFFLVHCWMRESKLSSILIHLDIVCCWGVKLCLIQQVCLYYKNHWFIYSLIYKRILYCCWR